MIILPTLFAALNIRGNFADAFYLRRFLNNDFPDFNYSEFEQNYYTPSDYPYSPNLNGDPLLLKNSYFNRLSPIYSNLNNLFYKNDFFQKTIPQNIEPSFYYSNRMNYNSDGFNLISKEYGGGNNTLTLNRFRLPDYYLNNSKNNSVALEFPYSLSTGFAKKLQYSLNPDYLFEYQKNLYKNGSKSGFFSFFNSSYGLPEVACSKSYYDNNALYPQYYNSFTDFLPEISASLIKNIGSAVLNSLIYARLRTEKQKIINKTPALLYGSTGNTGYFNSISSFNSGFACSPYYGGSYSELSEFFNGCRESVYKYGSVQSYFRPNSRSAIKRSGMYFNILNGNSSEDFTGTLYNNPFISSYNSSLTEHNISDGSFITPRNNLNLLYDKSGIPVPKMFRKYDYGADILSNNNSASVPIDKNSGLYLGISGFCTNSSNLYSGNSDFYTNSSNLYSGNSDFYTNSSGLYSGNSGFYTDSSNFYSGNSAFYTNSSAGYYNAFQNTLSKGGYSKNLFDEPFYGGLSSYENSEFDNIAIDNIREYAQGDVLGGTSSSEIKIDMSGMNNTIKNDLDLDDFIEKLTDSVRDAADNMAKGVHF